MSNTQLRRQTARQVLSTTIIYICLIGIAGCLGYLSSRFHVRLDLTQGGMFTLSPRSIEALQQLPTEVHVTGFYLRGDPQGDFMEDLLEEYSRRSDKITYQFIDPELKPAAAQQYGITSYNVMVFEADGKTLKIFVANEQDLTRAIIKVASPDRETVYFVVGHGERDPDNAGGGGYSQVRDVLEQNNYDVRTLNLAVTSTVPEDASVLIIAAPLHPLLAEEIDIVETYLAGGGSIMLLQDPGASEAFDRILESRGVRLDDNIVVDYEKALFGLDPLSPVVDSFSSGTITADIAETIFFGARSIRVEEGQELSVARIAETSGSSWGEADVESQDPEYSEGDTPGPLAVVVAMELQVNAATQGSPRRPTRLVIFGDSDFATNTGTVFVGNGDIFINAANWLAAGTELLSIQSEPYEIRRLTLQPQETRLLFSVSSIILPLLVLCAGALVWLLQR
jgi:ABC-type uncharacterized transport system involved in gliding motility auxiliary subunit